MKRKLQDAIKKTARGFAEWLNKKTYGWSIAKKKTVVILFFAFFGCISLYIVINTFIYSSYNSRPVFIKIPIVLNHIGQQWDLPIRSIISKKLFQRIESLKDNDSLLKMRPHLLDSIRLIEQSFPLQKIK
jgi:hypothetical protein